MSGPAFYPKKVDVKARHDAILSTLREGGVVSIDRLFTAARKACGATRQEVKNTVQRLVGLRVVEQVVPANRFGRAATYRMVEGAETNEQRTR